MKKLVVSKELFAGNVENVRKKAGNAVIYAVVKSNAYGNGLCKTAEALRANGINHLAVTEPSDALLLRENGFADEEILIIRSTAIEEECKTILDANVTASIGSTADAVMLNNLAAERGTVCDAHIKIDTGLGRYGFLPTDINDIISVFRLPNINVTGVFSHYSDAWSKKRCLAQTNLFIDTVQKIRQNGCEPGILHISASVSFLNGNGEIFDAIRVGSALYGNNPRLIKYGSKPVSTLESSISEIRWLPEGHAVGYSNAFVTKKPIKTALIPVGYYDGFNLGKKDDIFTFRTKLGRAVRALFSVFNNRRLFVTINGKRAKVLGHIGMNHTSVNVTDIDCSVGDKVIINGITSYYVNSLVEREYV
ncbi:MAG: alanine racemase [Clostridia bacterium]|nr:alanine racemase [Clostridia bacterium]